MTTTKNKQAVPEIREFIKENDQRLYDFCFYMLDGASVAEEVALNVFREFGEVFRRLFGRRNSVWEPRMARIRLFQLAWEGIQEVLPELHFRLSAGRDMRQFKGHDEDVLSRWQGERQLNGLEEMVLDRIWQVDAMFRAPVVLRDVLKFEDDEAVEILGVRWGVYRHRLHRGRLELKESLRGRDVTSLRQEAEAHPPR